MIVADTNLVVYLLVPNAQSPAAEAALRVDPEWVAPSSWRVECLNVLTTYCRADRLTVEEATAAYRRGTTLVRDMPFDVEPGRVIRLSKESGRSGYDCVFVAAAMMNALPLVTFDRQLLTTFPDTAIQPEQLEAWFARRGI